MGKSGAKKNAKSKAAVAEVGSRALPIVPATQNKSKKRSAHVEMEFVECTFDNSENSDQEESVFDGHRTMLSGELAKAKKKVMNTTSNKKNKNNSSFEHKNKSVICQDIVNTDGKNSDNSVDDSASLNSIDYGGDNGYVCEEGVGGSDGCDEGGMTDNLEATVIALKKEVNVVSELLQRYSARLEEMELRVLTFQERPRPEWAMRRVTELFVFMKLKNMNDGHCSEATDRTLAYEVHKETYGVCLHCLDAGRDPEFVIFKRGKNGVKLHRAPKGESVFNAKCVKAGIANPNTPRAYLCRMVYGKDYITFRYPDVYLRFIFEATNKNYRPSVIDAKTNKRRNMNAAEYKVHKINNASKKGPGWRQIAFEHLEPKGFDKEDYRPVLFQKWNQYQLAQGWHLGDEWRQERAHFWSDDDNEREENERNQSDHLATSDDEPGEEDVERDDEEIE